MKLRELLQKIHPQPLSGEGESEIDDVDALATMDGHLQMTDSMPVCAPRNWVPPQQDERPLN
jgi:hypothetical protein